MDLKAKAGSSGKGKTISVSDAVFAADYNEALIHQVVTAYMAGSRSGTKANESRADVSWRRCQAISSERHGPCPCWYK